MKEHIRIVLADDHELIRYGLKRIIEMQDNMHVVGEASQGIEALELVKTLQPDLAIIDMNMPYLTGRELISLIKSHRSQTKVIILTIEDDRETIEGCIENGADAYLLKDSAGQEIIKAIDTVMAGDKFIDSTLVAMLFKSIGQVHHHQDPFAELTHREISILYEMAHGKSNKEIADSLFIAEKTVKNNITVIFRKIDVKDRVNAVLFAIENHIDKHFK